MGFDLAFFTLCFLTLFSFLLTISSYSSQEIVHKFSHEEFPIKIDMEATRTHRFLKVSVFLKNLSSQGYLLNLKLIILKKSNGNLSKILQAKEIYLQGKEIALPFIAEFSVTSSDYYEIKLQVFDKKGNLLLEKTLDAAPLET